jgi:hypothetical protein
MFTKKNILINTCYKVLCTYERYEANEVDYVNYENCLNKACMMLEGDEVKNSVVDGIMLLKGLAQMGESATHKDVKQAIFHITNELDRNMEG